MNQLLDILHITPQTAITGLIGLLVLVIFIGILPQEKPKKKAHPSDRDAADYDFMSTHESIPSHYDLALAYLASGMKDKGLMKLRQVAGSNHPTYAAKAQDKLTELGSKE